MRLRASVGLMIETSLYGSSLVGVPPVLHNGREIRQEVRLLFSSRGRGCGGWAGSIDVLAHLGTPLDKTPLDVL